MSAPHPPLETEAAKFAAAFDHWWVMPSAGSFPFEVALRAFHAKGKAFVPETVVERLGRVRSERNRVVGADPDQSLLDGFLDAALDKYEGRYDYATYCALKSLNLPDGAGVGAEVTPQEISVARDRGLVGLLGSLLEFELSALEGRAEFFTSMRPDAALSHKRLWLVLVALKPSLARLDIPTVDGPDQSVPAASDVVARLDVLVGAKDRQRFALSLLPVHVVHDEVMFLRVLQGFELNFAWIAVLLEGAIARLETDADAALERLRKANDCLREASRLFPVIGSMQVAAFHDFRRFTEGASAIQSAGYKTVESLCRRPDEPRLKSVAYRSVPDVAAAVRGGRRTLDMAFNEACRGDLPETHQQSAFGREMQVFADQLLRWRQAHYELAKRFLGTRGGTGYTEGVPYLAESRAIPVFRSSHGTER